MRVFDPWSYTSRPARQPTGTTRGRLALLLLVGTSSALFGAALVTERKLALASCLVVLACALFVVIRGSFDERVLVAVVLLSGLVNLPTRASIGAFSGLGALTFIYALATVPFWIAQPGAARKIPRLLRIFLGWVIVVSCIYWPSKNGIQNILVIWIFFTGIAMAATLAEHSARFPTRIDRAFLFAGWTATSLYLLGLVPGASGLQGLVGPRSYALFALPVLGWALAHVRFLRTQKLLVVAILATILISLSRGAFAAACVMVALTWFKPSDIGSWLRTIAAAGLVIAAFTLAVDKVSAFGDRFHQGDVNPVFGVSINTTGRNQIWQAIWDDYKKSPWIGRGPGSADDFATATFAGGIDHPHNDYLRVIHDYGPIGIFLWIAGYLGLMFRMLRRTAGSARGNVARGAARLEAGNPWPHAAFIALVGVAIEMVVDNPMIEIPTMAPLAILVGIAIAREANESSFSSGVPR